MQAIPDKARQIMQLLLAAGAKDALIVGGFVRDSVMGIQSKDVDIEVYGMDMDEIHSILLESCDFRVDAVGKAFGVLKIDNEIDVSVPRRENKIGIGHRAFNVQADPNMSVKEAASRRDFTINSMAMNINGEILDPFDGQQDIRDGILRATSPAFTEDPLRVMRAMQFAARFGFVIEHQTVMMCRSMQKAKSELPKERLWEEWKKWALKGRFPGLGLEMLVSTHWDDSEIDCIRFVPQDPEWHPEGDVFVHTCLVVDQAAKIADREQLGDEDRMVLMFAALCHDFGKASTTEFIDGRWRARGHCEASVKPAEDFLTRIGAPLAIVGHVKRLVIEHLAHAGAQPTERVVRRLANRIHPTSVRMLSMVVEADHSGRSPLPPGNPFQSWVDMAEKLSIDKKKPEPILMGRHMIEMGVKPGAHMGKLLHEAFEAQLDGQFSTLDEALQWAKDKV